jgi:hypothetical protein
VVTARRHPRRGQFLTGVGRRGGEDGSNTWVPHVSGGREKAPRAEDVNLRRKRTSAVTSTARVG